MSFLYLDFTRNISDGKQFGADFFNTSLEEQYQSILRRMPIGMSKVSDFTQFINMCFNAMEAKWYYLSMPSFNREAKPDIKGVDYYNNVVVRPQKTNAMQYILPQGMNIILIGDIRMASMPVLTVKGIELIDENVVTFGEKPVMCIAACAFGTKTFYNTRAGKDMTLPDYGQANTKEPVLTRDFVLDLCSTTFAVPNPMVAVKVYEDWKQYIEFRKYYLSEQSNRSIDITSASVIDTYFVSKFTYRNNEEKLSQVVLDGNIKEFASGEQIVLTEKVEGAESFPLIRVTVDRNRKELLADRAPRKTTPRFEIYIKRFSRESMGLAKEPPRFDRETGRQLNFSYSLEDRYRLVHYDVEPNYDAINTLFEAEKKKAYQQIDNQFDAIKAGKLAEYMDDRVGLLTAQLQAELSQLENSLKTRLEQDVQENTDSNVIAQYKAIIAEHKKKIQSQIDVIKKSYSSRLDAAHKKKNDAAVKKLTEQLASELSILETELNRIPAEASLQLLYTARNSKIIEEKKKKNIETQTSESKRIRDEKKRALDAEFASQLTDSKRKALRELEITRDKAIDEKRENETIRRYCIYFKIESDTQANARKKIEELTPKYLIYNNIAEKTKIERQERALDGFFGGYVKNPFLASYLFAPEKLGDTINPGTEEIEWNLASLNEKQKEAVRKAVASESLFLLQGPPGTGKTQVIAEIIAQFTKKGKKVLVASETHKAIDNVFERLPKIPEIRPLRLIPSQSGKESSYGPQNLVDNFYANISNKLDRQVQAFEHFNETKETFAEKMQSLKYDYDRILRTEARNRQIEDEIARLSDTLGGLVGRQNELREKQGALIRERDEYTHTMKDIEGYRFDKTDDVKVSYLALAKTKTLSIVQSYSVFGELSDVQIRDMLLANIDVVKQEIAGLNIDGRLVELESQKAAIKQQMNALLDEDTEEVLEGQEKEYSRLRGELIAIGSQIKEAKASSETDVSDLYLSKFLTVSKLTAEALEHLPAILIDIKARVLAEISGITSTISTEIANLDRIINQFTSQENDIKIQANGIKNKIEELRDTSDYSEHKELSVKLKTSISQFFSDFNIVKEYKDIREALDIIIAEWHDLESNFEEKKKENQEKIPMYKAICRYLRDITILDEDRRSYTKKLYDNVNVIGITCTSRDKFSQKAMEELAQYNIDEIDVKRQGIDVVIIDEVSKSSFLDLLIPILYGKTVILVGDHRQLPPMYDLRNLRDDDFEGLNPEYINKSLNEHYTQLYEECFFKTLFEKVPESFRTRLDKQYRCHEQIMNVFNHFYGGGKDRTKGLQLGDKNQNDRKQHMLEIKAKGRTIIEPSKHVYFVDCNQFDVNDNDSTSIQNPREANVVIELLRKIDKGYGDLKSAGKFTPRVDKERGIDENMSVGVICTYGDQAGLIKRKLKGKINSYQNFNRTDDGKLIISTVDDFQGDERDIIIVSMVRNPSKRTGNYDFIKKFERINVAYSRARRLLIIVGARDFLSDKGIIDLPDDSIPPRIQYSYPVYREIINTIDVYGRILSDSDVLEEDK